MGKGMVKPGSLKHLGRNDPLEVAQGEQWYHSRVLNSKDVAGGSAGYNKIGKELKSNTEEAARREFRQSEDAGVGVKKGK